MAHQKLFEALQNVCNFTTLESDMQEIMRAAKQDYDEAFEFAKWIDREHATLWHNDDDKIITTEELYKEWASQNK